MSALIELRDIRKSFGPVEVLKGVDMDIYPSVRDCCKSLWPLVVPGGSMVFDDYGFWHLRHAARQAVDEYFAGGPDQPIVLSTGQAIVIKSGAVAN